MTTDIYDLALFLFVGYALGICTAWILADVQQYYRSKRA